MDFLHAAHTFQTYLTAYDQEDDKVRLKIIHTYGVISQIEELSRRMHLPDEDVQLAKLIALLHDIGRFEQLRRFDSFEPGTMDHAAYGVQILFDEGLIRQFLPDDTWDPVIRTAIARHSDYRLEEIPDTRTLLHARLIRDADKLDNCRVKLEDNLETILGLSAEIIGSQKISPVVYDTVFQDQCILSADRKTALDYWISYVAYFFDLNFRESLDIVAENDYVSRIIHRIPYTDPVTNAQMKEIEAYLNQYVQKKIF